MGDAPVPVDLRHFLPIAAKPNTYFGPCKVFLSFALNEHSTNIEMTMTGPSINYVIHQESQWEYVGPLDTEFLNRSPLSRTTDQRHLDTSDADIPTLVEKILRDLPPTHGKRTKNVLRDLDPSGQCDLLIDVLARLQGDKMLQTGVQYLDCGSSKVVLGNSNLAFKISMGGNTKAHEDELRNPKFPDLVISSERVLRFQHKSGKAVFPVVVEIQPRGLDVWSPFLYVQGKYVDGRTLLTDTKQRLKKVGLCVRDGHQVDNWKIFPHEDGYRCLVVDAGMLYKRKW